MIAGEAGPTAKLFTECGLQASLRVTHTGESEMFRFPAGLIDPADIEPYQIHEYITFETNGEYQVLDLDFNPENGGEWI
jgi:hypothetical protein